MSMRTLDRTGSSAVIELSRPELVLVNNALNEICNGVMDLADDMEFSTRLGVSRADARCLLQDVVDLLADWPPK